jgi:phospholipid/cholesterol/gamma-HCH transport system substrate-binding protein
MAMRRSVAEVSAGFIVLIVAVGFLAYALVTSGAASLPGYQLSAEFDRIDGLSAGSDVRMAGVKVGAITHTEIDPKTYLAIVDFSVSKDIKLPTDSSAEVTSDGMLGGKFLSLVPGGADDMLKPGGRVTVTQSSVSLEELLGKFIFSVTDLVSTIQKNGATTGAAPAAGGAKPAIPLLGGGTKAASP